VTVVPKQDMDEPVNVDLEPEEALALLLGRESQESDGSDDSPDDVEPSGE